MFVYYKCYILIELTFLKVLVLIKQVNQKSVIFLTIGISSVECLQRYHDLLMSMRLSDVVALNTKGSGAKNVK